MTKAKKIGIWMDHSTAHLMEFTIDPIETKTLELTGHRSEHDVNKSEFNMHAKEQQNQAAFYEKLGTVIKNYEEVILFGPTDAKVELFNILRRDHHFEKIKIDVLSSDKLTEGQQHAFVKKHFSN